MSTPLSEIESMGGGVSAGGDTDLVNEIMRQINGGSDQRASLNGGLAMPPPAPASMPMPSPQAPPPMMNAPMSNTAVASYSMDNGPATAHIIGGSAPTPADFAAAMHASGGGTSLAAAYGTPAPAMMPPPPVPKRSLTKKVAEEFKLPILVAILVFVFSLPVVNFLFAHYLPRFVLPTGQLTTVGLLMKSAAAGATFWLLQRVIIPLLSI